jgi:hypothetical protein
VWLEGLGKLKKKITDLIGNRTHYPSNFSIVLEPTTLPKTSADFQRTTQSSEIQPIRVTVSCQNVLTVLCETALSNSIRDNSVHLVIQA